MKNLSARSLQVISALLTSFLVFAFAYLAWTGFISDSEIWSVTIAKNFREEWFQPWVFSRILFYAPMALVTAPFETATSIFEAAKTLFFLNGLLILFFSFRLSRILSRSEGVGAVTPWLAVILILANTGFLNQGYRIRSDLVSCAFVLYALGVTFQAKGPRSPRQLLCWAIPFLATPKAALHVFPAIALLGQEKERRRVFLVIFLGFFLIVLVYPHAITFFLDTYSDPEARKGLFSAQRFVYLERIIANNVVIVCAFAFRFITWIARLRIDAFNSEHEKLKHRGFGFFIIGSVAVLILSPEKVPFFLASFLPVFSVFTSLLVDDVLAILRKSVPRGRERVYSALLMTSVILTTSAIALRAGRNWDAFRENNNSRLQFSLIRTLEAYLNKFPGATYYDVVGLVPQKATIRLFAGPNDPIANRNSFLMLEQVYKPDLIFHLRKMHYLKPGIGRLLRNEYFSIGGNAYARWSRLPAPLPLPIKNQTALDPLLNQMKKRAGVSSLPEFTALIEAEGKPARIIQLRAEDLSNVKIVGAKSRLTAVAPFTRIDHSADILSEIIRFDWDWTGATDPMDDLSNEPPLP